MIWNVLTLIVCVILLGIGLLGLYWVGIVLSLFF